LCKQDVLNAYNLNSARLLFLVNEPQNTSPTLQNNCLSCIYCIYYSTCKILFTRWWLPFARCWQSLPQELHVCHSSYLGHPKNRFCLQRSLLLLSLLPTSACTHCDVVFCFPEVGYIMPRNFSIFRISADYSPQYDIRKNLFFKNFDNIIPRRSAWVFLAKLTS